MAEKRIYFKELPCFQNASEKMKNRQYHEPYFELEWLPTERMQQEIGDFIRMRGAKYSISTILQDKVKYGELQQFLEKNRIGDHQSFKELNPDLWRKKLKAWMMANGKPVTRMAKNPYGIETVKTERLILYFNAFMKSLEPEDSRDERLKDVWDVDRLDIKVKKNPIYNMQRLNFKPISQTDMREEVKKAVYLHLSEESLGTVQGELSVMRMFSRYLKTEKPEIQSCGDIDREILESYLIYRMTGDQKKRSNNNHVRHLRSILETVGKLYGYQSLEYLFLNTDIPPEVQPEFRVYTDAEAKRLNAGITKMDVQIARCLIIHQMLGTRISDTLTLERDCLFKKDGHDMIRIRSVKTKAYVKPISAELAALIQKAMEETETRYGTTKYIFADAEDPEKPMQYTTVKHKILNMIQKENLRDDKGNYFKFTSHMFRHYYGVKLTELHLDDWTLARLLGHSRLHAVNHYRKMNNQQMADETRKVRDIMSKIIYANLDGWGAEYEQIR